MNEERAQIEKLQISNQELKEALRFAMTVIENYQMDIRSSEWTGVNLVAKGFCQGSAYLRAILIIKKYAHLPLDAAELEMDGE